MLTTKKLMDRPLGLYEESARILSKVFITFHWLRYIDYSDSSNNNVKNNVSQPNNFTAKLPEKPVREKSRHEPSNLVSTFLR
uniref:Uncharacterized protein n=1 Tax=Daphnia galeata TaxID=27404 RepID=A0A8J2S0H3_9CRUS|nr:unnamed protein product [Daphnia galeata]